MPSARYARTGNYAAPRRPAQRPQKTQTRRRPSIKFFAITGGFAAAVVILLVLLLSPPPTSKVERGVTEFNASYDMLIIRDEVAYQAMNYGRSEFIAREGEHVEAGDPIVKVYELGYSDETLSQLLDIRKTILDYEVNVSRAGVIDPPLGEINSKIDIKAKEIKTAAEQGSLSKLPGLELDIQALLGERMTYLNSVVVPDDQLRQYMDQERQLTDTINGWSSVVTAEASGAVSFYFDGCESVMVKENIGSFTKKALEEVKAGKPSDKSDKDSAYVPLYRVVSEQNWYVVFLSEKKVPEMFVGNVFSMVFDDYLSTQYTGRVFNIQELENKAGYVYTIQIEGNIGPMIGDRRASARLFTRIESLRIPRPCLKSKDGATYVERISGEYVPVNVIGSDADYVYIQAYQDGASLTEGELLKK